MLGEAKAVIALFPLLLPVWEQRPFEDADLNPGPAPLGLSAAAIQRQAQAFATGDQGLRCRVARQLRRTGMQTAFALLADQLQRESSPHVQATLLQQLVKMPCRDDALGPALTPFLTHDLAHVRYWAARLAGALPEPLLLDLGRLALNDPDTLVRQTAVAEAGRHAHRVGLDFFRQFWSDPDPGIRAAALVAGCRKPDSVADAQAFLQACTDQDTLVRFALASSLDRCIPELRARLAGRLKEDKHTSVRGAVSQAAGRSRDTRLLPHILGLARDRDPEVRRLTAAALAAFPAPAGRSALVELLGDAMGLVRTQAEASVVVLHANLPVDAAVATRLDDPTAAVRGCVYRALGRIVAKDYARAIHRRLAAERDPETIAAAVFALGCMARHDAALDVAAQANHDSPEVRTQVAIALGALSVPETFSTLAALCAKAQPEEVRQAAILGAGRIGDGRAFSQALLGVLLAVRDQETPTSTANRAAACWSAGRLRPVNMKLMERIAEHATEPVVPGGLGTNVFEQDIVLVSAAFALAQCARDHGPVRGLAERVLATQMLDTHTVPPKQRPAGFLASSPEVREYARQAMAYLDRRVVGQRPRPLRTMDLIYSECLPPEDDDHRPTP